MAKDIKQLQVDVDKLAEILGRRVESVMEYLALDLENRFIQSNPVDSGYCRSNWRNSAGQLDTSVNTPPTASERAANKGRKGWYAPAPSASVKGTVKSGSSVYVTNSTYYLRFLEEGTAKMAPRHFVKNAVDAVTAHMNAFIQKAVQNNPAP